MRFLPLFGVMALIFFLSHTPGQDMPQAINGLDKLLHGLAYATLAAAALWAGYPKVKARPGRSLPLILLLCLLYGISDEFHQSFIPGRYPSLADIIADTVGAALFLGSWYAWQRIRMVAQQSAR